MGGGLIGCSKDEAPLPKIISITGQIEGTGQWKLGKGTAILNFNISLYFKLIIALFPKKYNASPSRSIAAIP